MGAVGVVLRARFRTYWKSWLTLGLLVAVAGSLRPLGIVGTYDLDEASDAVQSSIRPQVIGWYALAGLAALAALAVIGQAMARQTVAERADQRALSALGVTPRQFVQLTLLRTLLTGAAGAAGAGLIAVLASPLTPVGEARLAVPAPVRLSLDAAVILPGALAIMAAVVAVAAWPAIRQARLLGGRPQWEPASVTVAALAGIVVGAPAGIAAGRVLWRVFATNFGVVPVAVVEPVLIAGVVAGVLAVANLLAAVPALLAARSRPAQLLRTE